MTNIKKILTNVKGKYKKDHLMLWTVDLPLQTPEQLLKSHLVKNASPMTRIIKNSSSMTKIVLMLMPTVMMVMSMMMIMITVSLTSVSTNCSRGHILW